ncbi:YjjG family noncanonical pyrimidine nucleotidase [Nonlabens xiamenensis]|uniref:YjjG family noncanonical pyrimidine nucleotidase n=1 Tax=Nonlabens xiamenensis TaxID=2341043 RepID=UPI000F608943|nr:YjjG family noncanonical pyrimidine nucleotidase [Nonlabens xiamenensis]
MKNRFEQVEHIFFDLDHTLWDFDLNSKLAYQQIFTEHNVDLNLEKFIEVYQPLNLQFWRMFRENKISKEDLRFQRLHQTFEACGFHVSPEKINLFADLYIEYLPNNNHLFAGCIAMLEQLKQKYKLHLITNGFNGVQQRKIKMAGLKDYFDVVLTAEAAGVKKPSPEIFHQALRLSGAIPENSLMIGDSYEADILGARTVGIPTIWFHTTDQEIPEGEVYVHELSEIQSLLR